MAPASQSSRVVRTGRTAHAARSAAVLARLLLGAAVLSLVAATAGGLVRLGIDPLPAIDAARLAPATLFHAALMIGGVFGTVIGIERAVALRARAAFAAPIASALGSLCLLLGVASAGAALLVVAGVVFVTVHAVLVRRQRASHTVLLLVGALAWLAGNVLFAVDGSSAAAIALWFAFLVLTIAAERLEMMRLMRRGRAATLALQAIVAAMLLGAAATAAWPVPAGVLYGAALAALAAWLMLFDIARRTVRVAGLSRYMALCLLAGYVWLAVAGVAWAATAMGLPFRDAALHALGLGFVFSMIMGHAPVIVPAVSAIKLRFGSWFYLAPALLHASLLVRLGLGVDDPRLRVDGAILNVAAIASFVVTLAWAAFAKAPRRNAGPRS